MLQLIVSCYPDTHNWVLSSNTCYSSFCRHYIIHSCSEYQNLYMLTTESCKIILLFSCNGIFVDWTMISTKHMKLHVYGKKGWKTISFKGNITRMFVLVHDATYRNQQEGKISSFKFYTRCFGKPLKKSWWFSSKRQWLQNLKEARKSSTPAYLQQVIPL